MEALLASPDATGTANTAAVVAIVAMRKRCGLLPVRTVTSRIVPEFVVTGPG